MRTLAIGDIHGCLRALTTLVNAVLPRPEDLLITLGDYVDRGPDSKGVVDYLSDLHASGRLVALRGNHDQMMLQVYHGGDPALWMACGGQATLCSYSERAYLDTELADVPESHWDFLQNKCVNYHEMEKHFFVHANVYPDLPLAGQPEYVLLWEKLVPDASVPHVSGKIMVCGHTRQVSGNILDLGHAICIDTAVYGGGWLTCLEIESGCWWQANEAGELRKGHLTPGVVSTTRR